MEPLLLETKLQIPPQPHKAIHRPRLIDVLKRGIQHHKVLLISTPAGYGKTTLLSQWVHNSNIKTVWLSVGVEDNHLERFLRYLLEGWVGIQPEIRESPLSMLLGSMKPDSEAVYTAFINAANHAHFPMVFILDDYHLIQEQSIHQAMIFLIDHLPPDFHFVLSVREDPPLPLARYRARGEMLELRARDLSFSPVETKGFLEDKMELDLADEDIEPLQSQLEGWIAGLQLAALAARQYEGAEELVVSGRHRFIADFLSEEVLAHQPEERQAFLLMTSILDQLCPSLCEALIREGDARSKLITMERENLFLVPLDAQRKWFRYHHIFADFLRAEMNQRFPADEVTELHRRAARWYLAHNRPEQSFHHAVEGKDIDIVLQIFERYIQAKLMGGELRVVKGWLDALPEVWHDEYPMIGLVRTGYLLFTGQMEACVDCVKEVEQRLSSGKKDDTGPQLARVDAVRCSIACFQDDLARAETFANQALRGLPEKDYFFRGILLGSLGDTYRRHGLWEKSKECYLEMLDFIDAPHFKVQSVHVYGALADLYLRQGRLKDAADYWTRALDAIQDRESWGRIPLPLTGWVHIRMGEIMYQWNELNEARNHLTSGLERAELGDDVRGQIAGYLILGRLELSKCNLEDAANYLERARPLVESAQFSHWLSRFERFQLELWLAGDRLRAAVHWADGMLEEGALENRPDSAVAQLAMARVLIFKGDDPSLNRALSLLRKLLQIAEHEGRTGITIESHALEALAYKRRGETSGAMHSLERALRLAEPQGYVRLFSDLGLPMALLLQESHSRGVFPEYTEGLLTTFSADLSAAPQGETTLPEPLTKREKEVLALMAAGLTNREIADELVISPETVKKHAGNIYGKLGVGGRTQAAARARELDILS